MKRLHKTWEKTLLDPYADIYREAVEAVATALRARFESGELRGCLYGDWDAGGTPPRLKIEAECARRWVTTPLRALAILLHSPHVGMTDDYWRWDRYDGGTLTLRGAAEAAMAFDVLALARERGWSKPKRGEEPTLKRSTLRAA